MSKKQSLGDVPTDDKLRIAMFEAMEQMFLHSQANTKAIAQISDWIASVQAGNIGVAKVVDDNESRVETDRQVAAQKEIISHLYEKGHQYVTAIIAGAFAAYFTTLAIMSDRFEDTELLTSALLMTISLTSFVLWEILSISYIGWHTLKGDYGVIARSPKWETIGWPISMFISLATALPAIGITVWVYLRNLGATEWLAALM